MRLYPGNANADCQGELQSLEGPRLLKLADHSGSRWVLARKGLPAGSGFNDAMVRSICHQGI